MNRIFLLLALLSSFNANAMHNGPGKGSGWFLPTVLGTTIQSLYNLFNTQPQQQENNINIVVESDHHITDIDNEDVSNIIIPNSNTDIEIEDDIFDGDYDYDNVLNIITPYNNENLTHMVINTEEGIIGLSSFSDDILQQIESLEISHINWANLQPRRMITIIRLVQRMSNLKTFKLIHCNAGGMAHTMHTNSSRLYLERLNTLLRNLPLDLQELDLSFNGLNPSNEDLTILVNSFQRFEQIEVLNLNGNNWSLMQYSTVPVITEFYDTENNRRVPILTLKQAAANKRKTLEMRKDYLTDKKEENKQ